MSSRLLALLVALVLALRLAGRAFPTGVERVYSEGLYPGVERSLSFLTGLCPFPVIEPLGLVVLVLLVLLAARRFLGGEERRFLRALLRAAGSAVALYLAFLVLWGVNYERPPLAELAGLDSGRPSKDELEELGADLVRFSNQLREGVKEAQDGVFRLEDGQRAAFNRAFRGYVEAESVLPWLHGTPPRAKAALDSWLLSRLGILGIYSPFTAEPLVNSELPDPDIPFTACHEMAHGLGFAREDEANYVASLACRVHPDADFRYSGVLASSLYVLDALSKVDREAAKSLFDLRSEGVKRDLAAMARWASLHEGRVSRVSRRVNDAYLRSHNQPEGIARYGRFVLLLAGERRKDGRLLGLQ